MKSHRKGHTQQLFFFKTGNQLTINFSRRHYTNFDRDKLFLYKSPIILLTTSKKWVKLMNKVSHAQDE